MYSNKTAARVFGVFFIAAFIAYGGGNGLIVSIINGPGGLANVYAHKSQMAFGAILMAIVHTFLNTGLAVIMLPTLKQYNKNIAYGYLSAAATATVMLIVGAIFLLLLVPLSEEYVKASPADIHYLQSLGMLCVKGNYYAYQVAMAIWGIGGLLFCYLLHVSRLVPRLFSTCGFIGYIIFLSGTMLELYGYNVGVLLDIPGGLFELSVSVWLIIKGFSPQRRILRATGTAA